ncbi:hypothetical protein SAMN04488602_12860 [Paenibacillus sp. cl123]|nr:hypothetical protein SAMN04488602_12860 [Paenibacillus sp. cl123]
MFPPLGNIKDIKKGSGFGKISILNDTLRVQPK